MNKKAQLELLFKKWENSDPNYTGKFVRDGIVDQVQYEAADIKILFLVKEANDIKQSKFDLAELLATSLTKNFGYRMAEWSFGILNDFPPLKPETGSNDFHQSFMKTAVMNLKKIGGSSSSKSEELLQFTKKDKSFILDELHIIKPQVIVGGIGDSRLWKILFEKLELNDSGYDIYVGRWESFKIIDFYHPSYRVSRAMTYSLLQNVVRSKFFKSL